MQLIRTFLTASVVITVAAGLSGCGGTDVASYSCRDTKNSTSKAEAVADKALERETGARDCALSDPVLIGTTARTRFVDRSPRTADTTYRIALLGGWGGDLPNSDMLMLSPPVLIRGAQGIRTLTVIPVPAPAAGANVNKRRTA